MLSSFRFESILFSILIGIGVDYVLHFGHAYSAIPGIVCKEKRTHHALTSLGPSVIGSAFTVSVFSVTLLSTSQCPTDALICAPPDSVSCNNNVICRKRVHTQIWSHTNYDNCTLNDWKLHSLYVAM